ncbi:amidohydrolase [Rubripirellula reticaptiva]|nr:amidohydrolase [Rubripirellula reticaptiva]
MSVEATELQDRISRCAKSLTARLREIRRYLHQRPELSEREYATTEFLANLISDLGLTPNFAGDRRGVWADVDAKRGEHHIRVAIRGDIDALPIQTQLSTTYASGVDNAMHACGHDAHATMAWGALAILNELIGEQILPSGFAARVIFQPAEETSTGGRHMIQAGALDGIGAAIALHVDPSRPVGSFGYRDGAFTAGCDTFHLRVIGQPGHSARPHLTGDTIGAASSWVTDIYRRLPRNEDAREAVVVNVGQFTAGNAPNIVPGEVHLGGTVRTLSRESGERARQQMKRITEALELSHPVEAMLNFSTHTPPVFNDSGVNLAFRRAAIALVGDSNVRIIEQPSMGAEDFSFFASVVPAAMMRIGVTGSDVGAQPLHTPTFDIDESVLEHGAAVLALAAIELSTKAIL